MSARIFCCFLISVTLVGDVHVRAIHNGVRAPIMMYPYAVFGHVMDWETTEWRFGGIIIDENKVVTAAHVCMKEMDQHYMVMGVANIKRNPKAQRIGVDDMEISDQLCMFRTNTTIQIGPGVQRAMLPEPDEALPPIGSLVHVAGFGYTYSYEFADELHVAPAFIFNHTHHSGEDIFLLAGSADLKAPFKLIWAEAGSPVVDPKHEKVIGVIAWRLYETPNNQRVVNLAKNRNWIEDVREKWDSQIIL